MHASRRARGRPRERTRTRGRARGARAGGARRRRLLRRPDLGLAPARDPRARALARDPSRFVRGNADRALLELSRDEVEQPSPRERWMLAQHDAEDLAFLAGFEPTVSVAVDGLGPTCFSPRLAALGRGVRHRADSRRASARVHDWTSRAGRGHRARALQYDREVDGIRLSALGASGFRTARAGVRVLGAPRAGRRAPAYRLRGRGRGRAHARDGRPARRADRRAHARAPPREEVVEDAERPRLRRLTRAGVPRCRRYPLA